MKKILSLVLLFAMVLCCFTGCGRQPEISIPDDTIGEPKVTDAPTEEEETGSLRWPKFGVCKLLPVPPSSEGYIHEDGSDEADIDVYEIAQDDFYQYVAECQEMGFVIDYYSDETEYEAYNDEGYYLWLDYDQEDKVMNIWIYYDGERQESEEDETEPLTEEPTEAPTEEPTKETEEAADGLRSEFKDAMDAYEAFMDEYVAFMKEYKKDPGNLSLLGDYAKFMAEYAEFVDDFEAWDNEEMNDAELAYYIEVQTRVNKKLIEVL